MAWNPLPRRQPPSDQIEGLGIMIRGTPTRPAEVKQQLGSLAPMAPWKALLLVMVLPAIGAAWIAWCVWLVRLVLHLALLPFR